MRFFHFLSESVLLPAARRIEARPKWQIFLLCTGITLAIGYIDYLAGNQITLSAIYAVPIALAAWFAGRQAGLVLAAASVALWIAGDFAIDLYEGGILIPVVNTVFRMAFYVFIVIALCQLSELQNELESRAEKRAIALAHETAERTRLQRQMLDISEREQRRIGQDLHDGLCQHLTGTALTGQILAETMEADGQNAAAARKMVKLVNESISLARGIAKGLDPVQMQADGLMQALEEFSYTVSEIFGVACSFDCQSPVMIHDQSLAMHLYRIAQEAVGNAVKHGQATKISILLDETENGLHLTVMDDGDGFDPLVPNTPGMGLRIMADRAKMVGGQLSILRTGTGMEVRCSIARHSHVGGLDA